MKKKILFLILMVLTLSVRGQEQLQEVVVYGLTNNEVFNYNKLKLDSIKPMGENINQISYLKELPSITYHGYNGTETGYIYPRVRGIDVTRLNFSLNGMPLNEPEDGGFYFNNIAGLSYMLNDMEFVTGSTLAKNGSSTLGGSLNMITKPITENYISTDMSMGYYNTSTLVATSSNTNKIVNSFINVVHGVSDGYKHNSWNKTNTINYLLNKQVNNKLYFEHLGIFSNHQNGMAWLGASKDQITLDKKFSNNTNREYDDFTSYISYLVGKYRVNDKIFVHTNLYYNYLDGMYTTDLQNLSQFYSNTNYGSDMYNNRLYQNWIGNFTDISYTINKLKVNIGYNTYLFQREHIGYDETSNYSNTGYKREFAPYTKVGYNLTNKLSFNGNIQYRIVDFDYKDNILRDEVYFDKIKWNFINFGVGVNYKVNDNITSYYSFGKNNREASRIDMFGGNDYYDPNFFTKLATEYVYDNELGIKFHKNRWVIDLPFYYMNFKNELALNGLTNNQGIHLHSTTDKSYRYGVELKVSYINRFSFNLSGMLSRNKIVDYNHVLSPESGLTFNASYELFKNLSVRTFIKYIGEMYIDPLNEHKLDEQYQIDMGVNYKFRGFNFGLGFVNITNKFNYTNGYLSDYPQPLYFTNTPFRMNFNISYRLKY